MLALIASTFACVFVLTLVTVHLGLKYMETVDKRRIAAMLQVVSETTVSTNLLKDRHDPEKSSALDRFLKSINAVPLAENLLRQAGLPWSATRLFRTMGGLGAGGALIGILNPLLGGPVSTGLALGLISAGLPLVYARRLRAKRMAKIEEQVPEAMDYLSRAMRAGHAFTVSIGMVGDDLPDPLGQEFRALFNEQNLGGSLESAFANFTRRLPMLDTRFFASAVLLQRQTGGNLSEILLRLSDVIRERFRLKGHVQAVSAHGRMTAGILTALPILTAIALYIAAPGYLQGMMKDPDGKKLILGAIVSQVIGNFVIGKIIKIKV